MGLLTVGVALTTDAVGQFVNDLCVRLPIDQPSAVARHRLDVVIRRCGQQKRSPALLARLQAALSEAGISCVPGLHEPGLTAEARLAFVRAGAAPSWVPGLRFPTESSLEQFLVANYRSLGLGRLKQPRPQYRLPSGSRIDVLFGNRGSDDLTVCELKVDAGGREVVAQPFAYADELRRTPLGRDRGVSVLILTQSPSPSLFEAVEALSARYEIPASWCCYRMAVHVETVWSTSHPVTSKAAGLSEAAASMSLDVDAIG